MPLSKHRKKPLAPLEKSDLPPKKPIAVYIIVYTGIFLMLVSMFGLLLSGPTTPTN